MVLENEILESAQARTSPKAGLKAAVDFCDENFAKYASISRYTPVNKRIIHYCVYVVPVVALCATKGTPE